MKNKNNWLELAGRGINEVPIVPEKEVDFESLWVPTNIYWLLYIMLTSKYTQTTNSSSAKAKPRVLSEDPLLLSIIEGW